MKHICFLSLSLCRGGAERVLAELCNYSCSSQYKVTVITCMNKPAEYVLNPEINHICIDKHPYKNIGERFYKRRKILGKILSEVSPDCIISFLPEPNFLCLSLKYRLKCPVIISLRNDPNKEYHNFVRKILMRMFYPKSNGCVFQTQAAREYFKFSNGLYANGIVIPNAINEKFICEEAIRVKRKVIVSVGRLDSQKNQALLIRVFARIAKKYPEYSLEIFGDGKLRKELEDLVGELNLQKKVFLKGKVNDLPQRICDAEMFVLTSNYEGMPNALIEAMTLGIPSIATDCPCGGPAFLIKHKENGQLIPMENADELERAIQYYIDNKEVAYENGVNAMKITEVLSPEKIYSQWVQYVQSVMNRYAEETVHARKNK